MGYLRNAVTAGRLAVRCLEEMPHEITSLSHLKWKEHLTQLLRGRGKLMGDRDRRWRRAFDLSSTEPWSRRLGDREAITNERRLLEERLAELSDHVVAPVVEPPRDGLSRSADPTTPEGAVNEFYDAFNKGDLEAIANNWMRLPKSYMEDPVLGGCRGWDAIEAAYRRVFADGPVRAKFEPSIVRLGETFLACGTEHRWMSTRDGEADFEISTTLVFRLIQGRWRQFHRHGSFARRDGAGRAAGARPLPATTKHPDPQGSADVRDPTEVSQP